MERWINLSSYTNDNKPNSLKELCEFTDKFKKIWVISISDTDVEPLFMESDTDICLKFEDYDPVGWTRLDDGKFNWFDIFPENLCFSDAQANRIVKFLIDIQNDKAEGLLLVNCHAGVSRSGAIITFAAEKFLGNAEIATETNPEICPNITVLEKLAQAWEINNGKII